MLLGDCLWMRHTQIGTLDQVIDLRKQTTKVTSAILDLYQAQRVSQIA